MGKRRNFKTVTPFGVGYGLLEPGSVPTTIKVANAAGTQVYTVNFTTFIKNVATNEIGNMGYNAEAIKANCMAIKMCGWWAKVAQYRDSVGADIQYGDVAYVDGTTNFPQAIENATSSISSYRMVSDASSGSKLFFAAYFAGSSNATGQGTGQLRQNGSNYLATIASYRYNWQQILHYYYDNSTYNNPNVGIVRIY